MKLSVTLTPARIAIAVLAIITGVYHLLLPDPMLMLNGLGYLGLLFLYFVQQKILRIPRPTVRWIFMGYTAITIILYFVVRGAEGLTFLPGMFIKLVELGLLVLLYLDK